MALEENKKHNELPIETPGKGASQEELEQFRQDMLEKTFGEQQEKIYKEMKRTAAETKKEEKDIPKEEYNAFVDKNTVSEERLNSIAEKVKTQQKLTDKEIAIFTNKTLEINAIIEKAATSEKTTTASEKKESLSKIDEALYEKTLHMLTRGEISPEAAKIAIDHIRGVTHNVVIETPKPEIKVEPVLAPKPAPAPTPTPVPTPKPASFHEKLAQSQKDNEEREEFYENIPSFNEKIQTVIEKWNDLFDARRDAFAVSLKVITPEDLDTALSQSIDANMLKQNQNLLQVLFIKQKAITDFLVSKYGTDLTKQAFEEQMKPFVEELTELAAKVDELRSLLGKGNRMTIEEVRRAKQIMSELNITVPGRIRTTKEGRERKEKLSQQEVLQKKQIKVLQAFIDKIKESKEEYKKKPKGKFAAIARWARNASDWALQFDFEREANRDIGKLQIMMDNMKDPNKRTNRLRQEYLKEKKRELAIEYPLMKDVNVDALWNAIPEAPKPQEKKKEAEEPKPKEKTETKEKELSLGEKLAQKLSGAQSLKEINDRLGNAISKEARKALTELVQSYKENKPENINKIKEDISQIFTENGVKFEDIDSVISAIALIAHTINITELGIVKKESLKERILKRFRKGTENLEKIGEVTSEKGKLKQVEKELKKTGKKIEKAEKEITKKEEKIKEAVTGEKTEKSEEPQKEPVVPPTSPETPVTPTPIPTETINKPEENKVITEKISIELEKINEDINNAKKSKSFKEYFSNNVQNLIDTLGNIERKIINKEDQKYIHILRAALYNISTSDTEEDLALLANYLEELLIDISTYDEKLSSWRKDTREAQKKLVRFLQEKATKIVTPKQTENKEELKENYKSFKWLTDGSFEYGMSEDENVLKAKINENKAEITLNEKGFRYLMSDWKSYSNETFDHVSAPYRGINFSDISVTPAIFRKEGDKWVMEKKGVINWVGGSKLNTTSEQTASPEKKEGPIRYKEYDKKFHYFDQGEKTSFSDNSKEGGENYFSYNSQTGEVLPLKEGWNLVKNNSSYFLQKYFDYNPYDGTFAVPIEELTFIPATIDKSGKLISKGQIIYIQS